MEIIITTYQAEDKKDWVRMNRLLLPDYDTEQHKADLEGILINPKFQVFMAKEGTLSIGFATVSLRHDYVEGATSSPTGYLEGIFVEESHRRTGLARILYKKAEAWCKEKGCTEMGSDTWTWNKASIDFHLKLGFVEDDILVHFIKDIK